MIKALRSTFKLIVFIILLPGQTLIDNIQNVKISPMGIPALGSLLFPSKKLPKVMVR